MKILGARFVLCMPVALLSLLAIFPTGGCAASAADDNEEASATTTSALQAQSQGGVTDAVVDTEGTLAPEPEEAAKKVVEAPLTRGFRPEGCATKTREGSVVTVKLDKCTGPFGKVEIVGSLIATFSKTSSNILHIDIVAGDGTTTNGHALTYEARADIRFDGTQRFLTYHGDSSGTTRRGKPFTRHTDLSIVADKETHCAQVDGVSKGTVGKYDVNVTVEGFKGCRDTCPSEGVARATVNGPLIKDASVEVTFDGTDKAHVKIDARKKRELDISLDCDAAEAAE